MDAGRNHLAPPEWRPALGASLALHGALAGAALLPFLQPAPPRPAMPGTVEVAWLAAPSAADPSSVESPDESDEPASVAPAPEVAPIPEAAPETPPLPAAADAPPAAPAEALAEPLPEPPPLAAMAEPPPEPFAEPEPLADTVATMTAAAEPPPLPQPARIEPARPAPVPAAAPPRPVARPAPSRPARPSADRQSAQGATPAPPAATPAAGPIGPVLVTAPRFRRPPAPPEYPPRALDFGITGTVMVRARVAPDGGTEEIRLWRSSGHALLDAAALAAVRRWAFEPAAVDGRRVEAWVEVPVHFRLR
jgi:protein TonB